MFLFVATHLGADVPLIARILESTNRCHHRPAHGKYHNMMDALDMKLMGRGLKTSVVFDFSRHNFDLSHRNLLDAHFLIVPCRPDLVMHSIAESFGAKAGSYFFNRLVRMRELAQTCPNRLVVPFEELGTDRAVAAVKGFLRLGRGPSRCGWSSPPLPEENAAMDRYNRELRNLKASPGWYERWADLPNS